jgi:hypothetical protein
MNRIQQQIKQINDENEYAYSKIKNHFQKCESLNKLKFNLISLTDGGDLVTECELVQLNDGLIYPEWADAISDIEALEWCTVENIIDEVLIIFHGWNEEGITLERDDILC